MNVLPFVVQASVLRLHVTYLLLLLLLLLLSSQVMRTGERVHLTNLHGTGRYRVRTVTLAMTMSVAVTLTVSVSVTVTVTVSMTMSETLNRSTRRMKRMIPAIRGGTVAGRLLLRLRRMMMTPWIRQSLSIDRNVLEESATVLVIPAIFRSAMNEVVNATTNGKRTNEEETIVPRIVRRCVVAYSSEAEWNRESGDAEQRENVGCIGRTLIGRGTRGKFAGSRRVGSRTAGVFEKGGAPMIYGNVRSRHIERRPGWLRQRARRVLSPLDSRRVGARFSSQANTSYSDGKYLNVLYIRTIDRF